MVISEIYHIDTWQHANFNQHSVNLNKYHKGVCYLVLKVFNMLPSYINIECHNPKNFKLILQKFVFKNSFYSVDEHIELVKKIVICIYDQRII